MPTFQGNEEMPPVCHYCGKFMEKKDEILGKKVWKCVNTNCPSNKQPHKMQI